MPSVEGSSKEPRMGEELRRQVDGQQPFLRVPSPARPHPVGGTDCRVFQSSVRTALHPIPVGAPAGLLLGHQLLFTVWH